MKKETMDLIEVEVNENVKNYNKRGYEVEVVYLPCILIRGKQGEVGGMEYPNTSTIAKSENKGINL